MRADSPTRLYIFNRKKHMLLRACPRPTFIVNSLMKLISPREAIVMFGFHVFQKCQTYVHRILQHKAGIHTFYFINVYLILI